MPLLTHVAPERPSNAQSRIALAIVGALVVVALIIGIQNVLQIGKSDGEPRARPTVTVTASRPTTPNGSPSTAPTPSPTSTPPAVVPVTITGGTVYAPKTNETDQNVQLAYDGDPGTMWRSRWYGSPDFNGAGGIGIVLDLNPSTAVITEVDLTLPAAQDVTVYAGNSASLDGAQEIGKSSGKSGTITLNAPKDLKPASKLIVWVTKGAPAEAPNHYRAQISEVLVR